MTLASIVTALVIGGVAGGAAALVRRDRRRTPVWVLVATGVATALAGTMVARLAGLDGSRLRPAELLAQTAAAGFALLGVVGRSARGVAAEPGGKPRGSRGADPHSPDRPRTTTR